MRGEALGRLIEGRSAGFAMTAMLTSTEVVPNRTFRLDLDDFDVLVNVLRCGAKTFRALADDTLLSEPYDLTALGKSEVRSLDVECHEPFLRFRFGVVVQDLGRHSTAMRVTELTTVAGDPNGEALLLRIEQILLSARRDRPFADWWRERAEQGRDGQFYFVGCALSCAAAAVAIIVCCGFPKSPMNALPDPRPASQKVLSVLVPLGGLVVFGLVIVGTIVERAKRTAILMTRGRRKKPLAKDSLDV